MTPDEVMEFYDTLVDSLRAATGYASPVMTTYEQLCWEHADLITRIEQLA